VIVSAAAPVAEHKTSPGPNSTVNRFPTQRANLVFNDVSTLMAGSEAVRVAQTRIKTLEAEKEHIRVEMEQLITSSETLQRRYNELKAQNESLERKHREKLDITEDEKAVLKTRLKAKEEELISIKRENEDLLSRFQSDLRKIRVRERELEHRQEMIRAEMVTVVAGKDEVIVELKRSLEKLHFELDNFRAKSADLNTKINEFYDRNHRTVKALRLALSVLELGDKKEES
jgi:chromosome segregation ATPase